MTVVHVASEVAPFSKTGGLADVAGSLPRALAGPKRRVIVVSPWYRMTAAHHDAPELLDFELESAGMTERVELRELETDDVRHLFIDVPRLFDRDGLYGGPDGDYEDNAERFALFCRAALEALDRLRIGPDVIHCHDWQTGPVPLLLASRPDRPRTVFTIHNLGYQGVFPPGMLYLLGIEPNDPLARHVEYHGNISLLKAGLALADRLTTVSPTYAREILTPELGFGMDGVLRGRKEILSGILNGIDTGYWNPETDEHLPACYSAGDPGAKSECKAALLEELGLDGPDRPLYGTVTRLAGQKGIDLIVDRAQELVDGDANLAVLGTGEPQYHTALSELAARCPGRVSANLQFNEPLAHRIYAGTDFFLMPSRYEPCGLGQMISLRYGSLPVAARTGGLADTVFDIDADRDRGNGLLFERDSGPGFQDALARSLRLFGDRKRLEAARERGMRTDFSWDARADEYARLYEELAPGS